MILRSGILGNQLLRSFLKLFFPFVQWIKTQTVLTGEIKRLNSLFIKSKISFNSCYIIPCWSAFTSWGLLVDPWLTHTGQTWARSCCASGRTRGKWTGRIECLNSDPNRKAFGVWLTGSNSARMRRLKAARRGSLLGLVLLLLRAELCESHRCE